MRRGIVLALAVSLAVTGCAGSPTASPSEPQAEPGPTTAPGTATDPAADPGDPSGTTATSTDPGTPTPTDTGTPTSTGSVEYVVAAGEIPEEIGSLEVTLKAVFVNNATDFRRHRCWDDTYRGPYKPTITPIQPPVRGCYNAGSVTVDLTELDGPEPLGPFDAPATFSAGHGFVVTEASAEYRNGSRVGSIKGAGGIRVNVVEGPQDGRYHVEFAVETYRDRPYRYWLIPDVSHVQDRNATDEGSDRSAPEPAVGRNPEDRPWTGSLTSRSS
ncbi:hypothetical protein BRD00_08850 [Halobacteriales archaeon QS_8_69_26]|nr:MAG: hypothetical protein BRD00_08850 [Halobacteriales archaeon QS_8_69_26]